MTSAAATKKIAGEYGLLVPFLRQSLARRHTGDAKFRKEMRNDVAKCIRALRLNRERFWLD